MEYKWKMCWSEVRAKEYEKKMLEKCAHKSCREMKLKSVKKEGVFEECVISNTAYRRMFVVKLKGQVVEEDRQNGVMSRLRK